MDYVNLYCRCWSNSPDQRPKLDIILKEFESLSSDISIEFIENNIKIKYIERTKGEDVDPSLKSTNAGLSSKFNPIIKEFFKTYKEINDICITAEHYKRTCRALSDRVRKADEAIRELVKQDDNVTFFNKKNLVAFRGFFNTVKRLKFTFDGHMKGLGFSISTENQLQTEKDNEALKKDTESFKEYLDKIDGGITDLDHKINSNVGEIFALKYTFEKQQNMHYNDQFQITDIICDEFLKIEDYNPPETSRGKVVKRTRKIDDKHAKIAYFGLSREFANATRNIGFDIQSIRYMAPEKLLNSKHKYDIKCEVYSMLLWEIAELKIPYEDEIDISKIYDMITKEQCHEKFSHRGVPQEWKDLIKETWHQNPKFRPSFADIFLTIQKLSEQKISLFDTNVNPTDEFHNQESETYLNFDEFDDMSIEEAIEEFYKNDGNKLNAWKCFDAYANIGDFTAKYWKAYFLYYNILNWPESEREMREKQATQLFKEAADVDIVDAQLMYGDCMYNGVGENKDTVKAVEYYRRAADNNNPIAMYKVGNIYYHGDGVKKDLIIGENFLRLAAYNQQKQAMEICKKYDIKL
ncbi:13651_t:CDS:2 [Dentiscutata heterogama]|uniref:13651_t:CDS:1 n=1 Tax=Dentiscutata heterogama TaxID=1316150 RepID=A0ACA9KPF8_9GLOM|nr:13651_t:CDS:2 [Dentiscutata heterogama]